MTFAITQIDGMEYASDAAVRAAYITNGFDLGYIKTLLHFNNSLVLDDSFRMWNSYGNAQLDSSVSKYGSGSALFDGSGDYLKTAITSSDLSLGTGDFTIHCWIKCPSSQASSSEIVSNMPWASNGWAMLSNHPSATANKVTVWSYNYNGGAAPILISTTSVNTDELVHVAFVRSGNTHKLYINGVAEATYSNAGSIDGGISPYLYAGGNGSNQWFKGNIDEFVFVKGSALWTSDFSVPTSETVIDSSIYLSPYAESSIVINGDYALKAAANQTTSLNKTLTRTLSTPLDLSGKNNFRGFIRSSRTGSNIKIGLHDSGGMTTEVTPTISSADTWQLFDLDISGVADANKDAIDQIIITVVNADTDNTFYLDDFFAVTDPVLAASKVVGYAVLSLIQPALNVSKIVGYAVLAPYVAPVSSGRPFIFIF